MEEAVGIHKPPNYKHSTNYVEHEEAIFAEAIPYIDGIASGVHRGIRSANGNNVYTISITGNTIHKGAAAC